MQESNKSNQVLSIDRSIVNIKRFLGIDFLDALHDVDTLEIMLNHDGSLWAEKFGQVPVRIGDIDEYMSSSLIRSIAGTVDKIVNADSPILECTFPLDGSRFSAHLPPIVPAPVFTVRKKASRIYSLDDYLEHKVISRRQFEILTEVIRSHLNIVVMGGTGSGKTTLTNALIAKIVELFPDERLLIAEDTGEIQCQAKNHVRYYTTQKIGLTEIIRSWLRMRPDRALVGEIRDHSCLDLLDLWNTGHAGGVTTIHANSAEDGLIRIRSLVSRHPYAPSCIEEVIGAVVQVIVYIAKTPDGRRVTEILKVDGYDRMTQKYTLNRM